MWVKKWIEDYGAISYLDWGFNDFDVFSGSSFSADKGLVFHLICRRGSRVPSGSVVYGHSRHITPRALNWTSEWDYGHDYEALQFYHFIISLYSFTLDPSFTLLGAYFGDVTEEGGGGVLREKRYRQGEPFIVSLLCELVKIASLTSGWVIRSKAERKHRNLAVTSNKPDGLFVVWIRDYPNRHQMILFKVLFISRLWILF